MKDGYLLCYWLVDAYVERLYFTKRNKLKIERK